MRSKIAFILLCFAHFVLLAHGVVPHHHHEEFVSSHSACPSECKDAHSHCTTIPDGVTRVSSGNGHTHYSCTIEDTYTPAARTPYKITSTCNNLTPDWCGIMSVAVNIPNETGVQLPPTIYRYSPGKGLWHCHTIDQRGPPSLFEHCIK